MSNFMRKVWFGGCLFLALVLTRPCFAQSEDQGESAPGLEQSEPSEAPDQGSEAEEKNLTGGVEADVNNRYIWHGLASSRGAVLNPYAWVSAYGFTLAGWANYVLGQGPNQGQFNELDGYLTYAYEKDAFSLEAGYEHYYYIDWGDSPDTGMATLTLSYAIKDFSVFTTQAVDVVEYGGAYLAEVGVGYAKDLDDNTSLESSLYVGFGSDKFNETYIGPDIGAVNLVGADVAFTYYPTKTIYLRPHAGWTSLLNDDLRDAVKQPDLLNIGVALGWGF